MILYWFYIVWKIVNINRNSSMICGQEEYWRTLPGVGRNPLRWPRGLGRQENRRSRSDDRGCPRAGTRSRPWTLLSWRSSDGSLLSGIRSNVCSDRRRYCRYSVAVRWVINTTMCYSVLVIMLLRIICGVVVPSRALRTAWVSYGNMETWKLQHLTAPKPLK